MDTPRGKTTSRPPHRWPNPFRRRDLVHALLLAVLAGCSQATVAPGPPPSPAPPEVTAVKETWDVLFLGESKAGTVHTVFEPVDAEDPSSGQRIRSTSALEISRFGQTVKMQTELESCESDTGEVTSFTYRTIAGPTPIVVEGRVRENRLQLVTSSAGRQVESEIPWKRSHGGFFAVEESLSRQPMKPGERRSLTMLMPGLAGVQVVTTTLQAQDWEETRLLDETRRLLKLVQTATIGDVQIESNCWTDERGEVLKSVVPSLNQTVYRTTRQQATETGDGRGFDLGWDSIVHVASPLPHPHETRRVVYRAVLRDQDPYRVFAQEASQQVRKIDEHTAEITVIAIRPDQPPEVDTKSPPTDADRRPNNLIQSDAPLIRELASQAVPAQAGPWQVCVGLEKWVHEAIRAKNFGQGFATAVDVAQTLEGDCTEHAVLLAALCRARQIPARVAVGLVYSAADQGFAFHMWDEVWVADRWIPLDATLGLGGIGAAHITLGVSDLAAENAEPAVLRVLQVINRLQLEVLAVQ